LARPASLGEAFCSAFLTSSFEEWREGLHVVGGEAVRGAHHASVDSLAGEADFRLA
jgi:hypothetical protein